MLRTNTDIINITKCEITYSSLRSFPDYEERGDFKFHSSSGINEWW